MKRMILFALFPVYLFSQVQTTEVIEKKKWVLHSNLNLPAAKFHLAEKIAQDGSKGYLELFSSYGVGMSLNYGTASMLFDLENQKFIPNETKFANAFGFQMGLLFSSKIAQDAPNNVNNLSIYGGINLLDLQLGMGYELGSKLDNTTGWFLSLSYGIPLHSLSRRASYIFKKKPFNFSEDPSIIASL